MKVGLASPTDRDHTLALDFCVPTRSAPIDGRPAAQMQTAIRSAASSGVLNCLGAAYAYLMVFLLSRRAFGVTLAILLLCVYRWCFALVRHGHLRTGVRRYTSVCGRWGRTA